MFKKYYHEFSLFINEKIGFCSNLNDDLNQTNQFIIIHQKTKEKFQKVNQSKSNQSRMHSNDNKYHKCFKLRHKIISEMKDLLINSITNGDKENIDCNWSNNPLNDYINITNKKGRNSFNHQSSLSNDNYYINKTNEDISFKDPYSSTYNKQSNGERLSITYHEIKIILNHRLKKHTIKEIVVFKRL